MRASSFLRAVALALAAMGLALPAQAANAPPAEVASEVPGAAMLGSGRLTFLGLRVYEARLWSDENFRADPFDRTPFAIEIGYARSLRGRLIAERSLEEMRRAGPIADAQATRWLATMTQLFPDVNAGDRLTGVLRPGESARFFLNGKLLGEVRDAEFAKRFFGIWLSPKTSEPSLRESLLGAPKAGS
jgi:hypothetical protein